ncbi:hypothetical protein B0H10DRAFT_2215823 [Mycena sp. CBHHK59/15]|nr:hypothetical protein B0H10DRAFT_2215823 [Mycena sp. CBHHK59/15]
MEADQPASTSLKASMKCAAVARAVRASSGRIKTAGKTLREEHDDRSRPRTGNSARENVAKGVTWSSRAGTLNTLWRGDQPYRPWEQEGEFTAGGLQGRLDIDEEERKARTHGLIGTAHRAWNWLSVDPEAVRCGEGEVVFGSEWRPRTHSSAPRAPGSGLDAQSRMEYVSHSACARIDGTSCQPAVRGIHVVHLPAVPLTLTISRAAQVPPMRHRLEFLGAESASGADPMGASTADSCAILPQAPSSSALSGAFALPTALRRACKLLDVLRISHAAKGWDVPASCDSTPCPLHVFRTRVTAQGAGAALRRDGPGMCAISGELERVREQDVHNSAPHGTGENV